MTEAFSIFVQFEIILLAVFIIGELICFALNKNYNNSLFVGFTSVVISNALISTSGKSIFVILLAFLCVYLILTKKDERLIWTKKDFFQRLCLLIGFSIPVWIYYSFILIDYGTQAGFLNQFYDVHFWAALSKELSGTGSESVVYYQLENNPNLINSPFHFFDLWLNNISIKIFGIGPSIGMVGITYPLLAVLAVFSFFLFVKDRLKQIGYSILFSFLLLVIGGFLVAFNYENWVGDGYDFFQNKSILEYTGFKLLILYPIILFVIDGIENNNYLKVSLCSLFLLFVFPSTIIAVFGIQMIVVIVGIRNYIKLRIKSFVPSILFFLGIISWIGFYFDSLFNQNIILPNVPEVAIEGSSFILIVGEKLIQIILYFPLLLLAIVFFIKEKKWLLVSCIISSVILSLCFSALNVGRVDYWQFFTNYSMPLFNILSILGLLQFWPYLKQYKLLAITVLLVVFSFRFYNHEWTFLKEKVFYNGPQPELSYRKKIKEFKDLNNVLIYSRAGYDEINFVYNTTGNSMFYNESFKWHYNISSNSYKNSYPGIFYSGNNKEDLESFILKKGINALILEKGVKIKQWFPMNLFKFEMLDSITGESFYSLRKQ